MCHSFELYYHISLDHPLTCFFNSFHLIPSTEIVISSFDSSVIVHIALMFIVHGIVRNTLILNF